MSTESRATLARIVEDYDRQTDNWPNQRLALLILDAHHIAQMNQHSLTTWLLDDRVTAVAQCIDCNLWAIACSSPEMDDDELSGSCLAVVCQDKAVPIWAL